MFSKSGGNNNPSVANAGISEITQTMLCQYNKYSSGVITYSGCDASDDTVLSDGKITHDAAFAAGWKFVGSGCSNGSQSRSCSLFHK